jgi:hypothetical protein
MTKFKTLVILIIFWQIFFTQCASHSLAIIHYSGQFDSTLDDNCRISGRVINGDTKEPLSDVYIFVLSTSSGASTDYDGNYKILKMPPGIYDIKVSRIGFETFILSNYKLEKSHKYVIDFELVEEPISIPF